MIISYSPHFQKRFKKLSKKIQNKFRERLRIFLANPYHPLIKNHPLKGTMTGCRSFSVTGDFRAIYLPLSKDEVQFIDIGTHPQVY